MSFYDLWYVCEFDRINLKDENLNPCEVKLT